MGRHSTNLAEAADAGTKDDEGNGAEAGDAGWRPDPTGRYEWRYWDGGWTNRVASSRPTSSSPAPPVPAVSPAAPAALAVAPVPWAAVAPPDTRAPTPTTPAALPSPESVTTSPGPLPVRAWRALLGFFASFASEPESYRSAHAVDIDPDRRGERMLAGNPANYGRAGLVALAACGVATGSFLPWLSGTIDGIPFQRNGFQENHGWSFTIAAFALVCAALLAVRLRPLRWVAMGIALVLAGLTFRDLVHYHDIVITMNASSSNSVDLGTGMWIMAGCAIVALVASFRLGEVDQ
jgi:hypothetical protein